MKETTRLVLPTSPESSATKMRTASSCSEEESKEQAKGFAYQHVVVKPWYGKDVYEEKMLGCGEEEELVELRMLMMHDRQSSPCFFDVVHSYWQNDKTAINSRGCILKILLFLLLGCTLLLGLPHYYFYYSSSDSTQNFIILGGASNQQLHLRSKSPCNNTIKHRTSITFGELAQQMLPCYYSKMMSGLAVITDDVMPDQIYSERKAILEARDLMDVFSPVYPPSTSSASDDDDMWMVLRSYLDDGYTVLGDFQDLYASHANYTSEYFDILQGLVLTWNVEFETFRETHDIPTYLSASPSLTSKHFSHDKESKLFWRRVEKLPRGNDLATDSLHILGAEQVHTTFQYMKKIAPLTSVLDTVGHAQYHEVRKLLRSLLDEYKLFGTLMFPDTNLTLVAMSEIDTARHLLGDMNDHYVAYTLETMLMTTTSNNTQELERLANEIQEEWNYIKSWMIETDLEGTLKSLQQEMLAPTMLS